MANVYPQEVKDAAKFMYLRKVPARDIKDRLNLNNTRVIYQWAEKGNWDAMLQHEGVEQATSRKLIVLIEKDKKTDQDYKEITELSNLLDKMANIELKKARITKEKSRAGIEGKDGKKKKASGKNDIGDITKEQLDDIRNELFYGYQKNWHDNKNQRTRFILKSRQIGATYYFAWEAFEDAIINGDDQIFLSASKNQAMIFKAYILKFALEYFDVTLKGAEAIELTKNGKPWATLRFVSTNGRTAQGYHGHLYVDEVFWIPDFEKLNKIASGMASHKKWRKTYFSTPSVKSHGAYPMWCGDKYNEKRKTKKGFDLGHKRIHGGNQGPDNIWRDIVTVEDAANEGCDLFDITELKTEYTKSEFNNLFMCAFMEAGLSVFDFNDLMACAVDSNVTWADFKTRLNRPFGNLPVWIGYDPARIGDRSTVVVLAPPIKDGGKFRVLEKLDLKGTYKHQASKIKLLTEKYNVQFIGIDATGPGVGVFEEVKAFYKRATPIIYGLDSKTKLVLKAMDVIEAGRIEWDSEQKEIAQAFLQVYQTTTGSDQITYAADRTSTTGHADVAWSIMHALSHEPLTGKRRKASVSI